MHIRFLQAAALAMLGALSAYAARKDCYVIDRNGAKVAGVALAADDSGNLSLQLEEGGGPRQSFKAGTYRFAFIPMPREVEELDAAAKARKTDVVLAKGKDAFERYKYLGWGGHVAYLQGMAMLEQKQAAEALKTFENGRKFAGGQETEIQKGCVLAFLDLGKPAEAKAELEKMAAAEGDETVAFAFNLRGKILAQEGKKKDAVVQYLKTLLLFKPGSAVEGERDEARKAVVALLKEMGDPRAAEFEKMP